MAEFDFTRLTVYQYAVEFLGLAERLAARLPPGRSYIADQLQRGALSMPLNLAEGAGEFSPKEKARFYRMARRSATECAALLHACVSMRLVPGADIEPALAKLQAIVAMLTG